VGKADVLREETSKCTEGPAGVGGQTFGKRFAELRSGRIDIPPGPTATGKDPGEEQLAKPRGG